jgi:hypothetical protein
MLYRSRRGYALNEARDTCRRLDDLHHPDAAQARTRMADGLWQSVRCCPVWTSSVSLDDQRLSSG